MTFFYLYLQPFVHCHMHITHNTRMSSIRHTQIYITRSWRQYVLCVYTTVYFNYKNTIVYKINTKSSQNNIIDRIFDFMYFFFCIQINESDYEYVLFSL